MALSKETVQTLLREYLELDLSLAEVERLLPRIERQQALLRQLRSLDLGGDDPRTTHYIDDRRVAP
jgi:hypothetical protein